MLIKYSYGWIESHGIATEHSFPYDLDSYYNGFNELITDIRCKDRLVTIGK